MDVPLWPARNAAEFAYCPRLFYFMEVEGIHIPSDDTEAGQRVHRRVDEPSQSTSDCLATDAETGQARPVRSLTLTSNRLGLTATLDVAEIDGRIAVPVEYRKGKPQRSRHTPCDEPNASPAPNDTNEAVAGLPTEPPDDVSPWPTDRV